MSTVTFVLVAAMMLSLANRVLSPLLSKSLLILERNLFASILPAGVPNPLDATTKATEELASTLAVWELLRALPFLAANAALFWIALRMRKGERRSLDHARKWIYGAMAALAVSVVIQATVTIPATLAFSRKLVEGIPKPPGPAPFDLGAFTGSLTLMSSIMSAAFSTLALAAWPIILWIWSARLEKALHRDGFWSGAPPAQTRDRRGFST